MSGSKGVVGSFASWRLNTSDSHMDVYINNSRSMQNRIRYIGTCNTAIDYGLFVILHCIELTRGLVLPWEDIA